MKDFTLFPLVVGGDSRQESVRRGLESLRHHHPTRVLIHDAARPLVSHAMIDRILAGLGSHDAVIPVLPVTDTLKQISDGTVGHTVDRATLFSVQTPQGFDYAKLASAHDIYRGANLTDDAAVMEKAGHKVAAVEGDPITFKITTPSDIDRLMHMTAQHTETRTAMGFDVHALKPFAADAQHKQIKICGVAIEHTHYLEGHSDADVGLHAITDALLGTIAAGDIGQHFPPSDERWKGANSNHFLQHAAELVAARGGKITHLDVTIIGERPKISPHRDAMQQHIAQLLKLPLHRISIKATTTEKLGFTGRGEGLAAQAVATVTLPGDV